MFGRWRFAIYSGTSWKFVVRSSLPAVADEPLAVTRHRRVLIVRAIALIRFPAITSIQKKALRISSGALLGSAENTLINNFDKIRIAWADHPLRIHKAVNINRDPAAIHEREVRIPDQPEMSFPESLDEELLRMPPKTEHFSVTRPELLLVHRRRLIHVRLIRAFHVRLISGRTFPRRIFLYLLRTTLNVLLSMNV